MSFWNTAVTALCPPVALAKAIKKHGVGKVAHTTAKALAPIPTIAVEKLAGHFGNQQKAPAGHYPAHVQ